MGRMEGAFMCSYCSKRFQYSRSLKQHEIKFHNREKNGFNCAVCDSLETAGSYETHLFDDHGITLEKERIIFFNNSDFLLWKGQIERKTGSYYVLKTSKNENGKIKKYFRCNRSGKFNSKAKSRQSRLKGSRKIGAKCPAEMVLSGTSDPECQLNVLFVKTHVGHEVDPEHLNLPKVPFKKATKGLQGTKVPLTKIIPLTKLVTLTNKGPLSTKVPLPGGAAIITENEMHLLQNNNRNLVECGTTEQILAVNTPEESESVKPEDDMSYTTEETFEIMENKSDILSEELLEEVKQELTAKLLQAVDYCQSIKEISIIENALDSLIPTISSLRGNANCEK